MALTLAQAKELSQDKFTGQVIDEFRQSPLLDMLPFDNCVTPQGNSLAYVYNRVSTLPTAAVRAINAEYVAQEAVTTQYTTNLKIFGGSFDLDRVIIEDEKAAVDHVQFQMAQKVKATIALFHDLFINGDSGSVATQFDGIDKALTSSTTEITPTAAINLSTSALIDTNWKTFLFQLRQLRSKLNGSPSLWMMNSACYAAFQSVMDVAGINLLSKDNFGFECSQWGSALVMEMGDKPGTANPVIATTSKETSIYAVKLGLDALHGVSPKGDKLVKQYLPNMLESKAVKNGSCEMVAGIALKATRAAGVLRRIQVEA